MGTEEIITKAVPGYEGLYEVDTLGRVWSLKHPRTGGRKQLKGHCDTKGYVQVVLIKNKVRKIMMAHRIVASMFIPNPLNKSQVNHKNGVKIDNYIGNLEWMTGVENMQHSFQVLGRKILYGIESAHHKLSDSQVLAIWREKDRMTLKQLSKQYNVTMAAISLIKNQRTWKWLTDKYGT